METKFSIGTFRVSGCHACGKDVPAIVLKYGRHKGAETMRVNICPKCEQDLLRQLLMRALNDGRI